MPRSTRSSVRKSKKDDDHPKVVPPEPAQEPEGNDADESMEDCDSLVVNGVVEDVPTANGDAEMNDAQESADNLKDVEAADSTELTLEKKDESGSGEESDDEGPPRKQRKESGEKGYTADAVASKEEPTEAVSRKSPDTDESKPVKEEPTEDDATKAFIDRDRRLLSKMPTASSGKLTELEKYWKPIKEDPYDFTGWTYLLQYVDQGEDVDAAVEVYREFLSRYPFCYGYWKKYADYLKKRNTLEAAEKVFEEGLKAIPLSVDLWLHYANHVRSTYEKEENGEDLVRVAMERAAGACGLEYRSSKFWELYIKWETEKARWANVMKLYDRLLKIPTLQHATLLQGMKDFVNEHNPKDFLDVDEFIELRKEVLTEFRAAHGLDAEVPVATNGDTPPGDEAPPGDAEKETPVQKSDEETKAIREKVIARRMEVYATLEAEIKKRQPFEDALKRPYFHVKPLEKGQLKTWREYLDFEIKEGDPERIRVLFERCFIACALYDEFWLKYVDYLQSINASLDSVADVFHRACTVHLRRRLSINLQYALFEERRGDYAKAMEVLDSIEDYFGVCLAIAMRKIGLARRSKKFDEVERFYGHYVDVFVKRGDRAQADALAIKLSRFVDKVLKDRVKAESIVHEALKRSPDNPRLYMHLVDVLLQEGPERNEDILAVFEKGLNSDLPNDIKLLFAHRKMEYLEDFGDDVSQSERAYDEYAAFVRKTKEDRKRGIDEGLDYDVSAAKKARAASKASAAQGSTISVRATGGSATSSSATSAAPSSAYGSYGSYSQGAAAAATAAGTAPSSYAQQYPNYSYGVGYQQNNWNYGSAGHYSGYSNPNWSGGYNYYGQR